MNRISSRILLVEDDRAFAEPLRSRLLARDGWSVDWVPTVMDGLRRLEMATFDVVILDWYFHPNRSDSSNGDEFLRRKDTSFPDTWVIVYSSRGDEVKEAALKWGADDFIVKGPASFPPLLSAIEFGFRHRATKSAKELAQRMASEQSVEILGTSAAVSQIRETIQRVASSSISVLLRGEPGTGKDLIARAIHAAGSRKDKPFVVIHCPSLSDTLLESEMFGHTKGAFTGAYKAKKGLLEYASGGTVFLNEIGDLPLTLQSKILHAVEHRTFRRVGSNEDIHVDIRFISATNRDVERMRKDGTFRADLFDRMNGISIQVPPLRERREDIPILLKHCAADVARKNGARCGEVPAEALESLKSYDFPGNVRELQMIVERAFIENPKGPLKLEDFGLQRDGAFTTAIKPMFDNTLKDARATFEKQYLLSWHAECSGNVTRMAEEIGISRNQLHRLLRMHEIEGKRKPKRKESH